MGLQLPEDLRPLSDSPLDYGEIAGDSDSRRRYLHELSPVNYDEMPPRHLLIAQIVLINQIRRYRISPNDEEGRQR